MTLAIIVLGILLAISIAANVLLVLIVCAATLDQETLQQAKYRKIYERKDEF